MPTYDYKCQSCKQVTTTIHGLKEKLEACPSCFSKDVFKTIAPFAAKTENTAEHRLRMYQEQGTKDLVKFHKDDNFAANITGFDDEGSAARRAKIIKETKEKNEKARETLKKEKN